MKALSLLQPWASLLAGGEKRIETRGWKTAHRGRLAIHASKTFRDVDMQMSYKDERFKTSLKAMGLESSQLPRGAIIGVGSLEDVVSASEARKLILEKEAAFGNYDIGRWAWIFVDLCVFEQPIPCAGMPGLWNVPEHLLSLIETQRARS